MRPKLIYNKMVYQSMLTQFYNRTLRCGHSLPSQQVLCRQNNIGITTIRKVMHAGGKQFIRTASGKRAVVCFCGKDRAYIFPTLLRGDVAYRTYAGDWKFSCPPSMWQVPVFIRHMISWRLPFPAAGRRADSYKPYIQINQFLTEFSHTLNNRLFWISVQIWNTTPGFPICRFPLTSLSCHLTEGYACSFYSKVSPLPDRSRIGALSDCLQQIYRGMGVCRRLS